MERLDKIIASQGKYSRSVVKKLIKSGLVTLNGEKVRTADIKADAERDTITVDGEAVSYKKHIYIMLNKPRGYVTTMADEKGRKIAAELLKDVKERVYPVGRLDRNSEGLLIFTNDGEFANDIMHPSRHVAKTYRVTIDGRVKEDQLSRLMAGVEIEENVWTLPCTVEVLTEEPERTVLRFVIKEGRNRQIRRMCEAVGLQVGRLRRTAIGGVKLGMLKPGEYRDLTKEELKKLRTAVGKSTKQGR